MTNWNSGETDTTQDSDRGECSLNLDKSIPPARESPIGGVSVADAQRRPTKKSIRVIAAESRRKLEAEGRMVLPTSSRKTKIWGQKLEGAGDGDVPALSSSTSHKRECRISWLMKACINI